MRQVTDPNTGKRRTVYGKTSKEVQAKVAELKVAFAKGQTVPEGKQTLKDYLTSWLETVALEIRPSTFNRYAMHVNYHLIPALGARKLAQLTPQQVQTFYAEKVKSGLSPTSVRFTHAVLHRALKDALRLGLVPRNVTDQAKAPRPAHKEMVVFSEEQAQRFLEAVAPDRLAAIYALALTTGMREAELLALHWRDVDLERGVLVVRWSLQRIGGKKTLMAEPKTKASRRTIGLSQTARIALRTHQRLQGMESQRAGALWREHDLVFCNEAGEELRLAALYHQFQNYIKALGFPRMRFHDLRHTAATLLLARGINVKVVSEMLGHSSVAITLQIYAHVTPHMQQAAADVMDAVFRKNAQ